MEKETRVQLMKGANLERELRRMRANTGIPDSEYTIQGSTEPPRRRTECASEYKINTIAISIYFRVGQRRNQEFFLLILHP